MSFSIWTRFSVKSCHSLSQETRVSRKTSTWLAGRKPPVLPVFGNLGHPGRLDSSLGYLPGRDDLYRARTRTCCNHGPVRGTPGPLHLSQIAPNSPNGGWRRGFGGESLINAAWVHGPYELLPSPGIRSWPGLCLYREYDNLWLIARGIRENSPAMRAVLPRNHANGRRTCGLFQYPE